MKEVKSKDEYTDFKEVKKLTEDELKELNDCIQKLNSIQMQIGGIESQKFELLNLISSANEELKEVQKSLETTYGAVNIDISTGEIVEQEKESKYSVYIKKGDCVLPWKDFNKNMSIAVEYNLEY